MDVHVKVASAIHVAFGVLTLLVLAVLTLFMGSVAALGNFKPVPVVAMAAIGGIILLIPVVFGVAETVAGIYCFRGSRNARIWLIVLSLLSLFNFPFGTALGGYTLWALLRTIPEKTGVAQSSDF